MRYVEESSSRSVRRGAASAALAAGLAACSGGGGGGGTPTATPPPPIVFSHSFPANVAVAAGGGTAWDIVGVTTTLTGQFASGGGNVYDTLRVDVTFSQNVASALPAPGQPLSALTQLGIAIGLDTDGNPNTGNFKGCNLANSQTPFEYATDPGNNPGRLSDGNFSIIGADGSPIYIGAPNPPAEAQTVVNGNVISQTIFLPSVGVAQGTKVPKVGIVVASINGSEIIDTDCVPQNSAEIFTDGS